MRLQTLVVAGLTFLLTGATSPLRPVSVAQTLAKMPDCARYYQALVATKEDIILDSLCPSGHCFTVFAATDDAFAQLRGWGLGNLFDAGQERKLAAVITYSIVATSQSPITLPAGQELHTMNGTGLRVERQGSRLWVVAGSAAPVELRAQPIQCDNGAIFVVDEVLVPLARRVVPVSRP